MSVKANVQKSQWDDKDRNAEIEKIEYTKYKR